MPERYRHRWWLGCHSAVAKGDALVGEEFGVLGLETWYQTPGRGHDPPPRQAVGGTQHSPHRASSAGKSGFGCYFSVGHYIARPERTEYRSHRGFEIDRRFGIVHCWSCLVLGWFETDQFHRGLDARKGLLAVRYCSRVDEQ